ncbi:MAG TPA: hypothetical protein VM533_07985 [Fimbriiglobus sp.]|jgi:hypothetical protein|nr:hypothetical protein [Fimbriiglobus sp.]
MWQCVKCREQIEDNFGVCWNCGTGQDGTEDPGFRRADGDPADPTAARAGEHARPGVQSGSEPSSESEEFATSPLSPWLTFAAQVLLWPLFVGGAGLTVWSVVYLCTPIRGQGDAFGHYAAALALVIIFLPVMLSAGSVLYFICRERRVKRFILVTFAGIGLATLANIFRLFL